MVGLVLKTDDDCKYQASMEISLEEFKYILFCMGDFKSKEYQKLWESLEIFSMYIGLNE